MNLAEPINIRTGRPFDSRRQHLHHPSIHGASIEGNWGRARGLVGGAFMGAMLAQQGSSLPYDAEVAWIGQKLKTGLQNNASYIFVDYYIPPGADADVEISCGFMIPHPYQYATVYADYYGEDYKTTRVICGDGRADRIYCGYLRRANSQNFINCSCYNDFCDSVMTRGKITVNGVTNTIYPEAGTDQPVQSSLTLFGKRASSYTGEARISYFSIKKNGVTEVDMIPVRKDGIGYFYDRARRRMFGNASENPIYQFDVGPDKS